MEWLTFTKVTTPRVRRKAKQTATETPSEFARRRLGFEADETQQRVLDSPAKRGILNCSRQWGKSTVAAVKALHRAWSGAGRLVLVTSPSGRQSAEFLRKVKFFARRLGVRVRGERE